MKKGNKRMENFQNDFTIVAAVDPATVVPGQPAVFTVTVRNTSNKEYTLAWVRGVLISPDSVGSLILDAPNQTFAPGQERQYGTTFAVGGTGIGAVWTFEAAARWKDGHGPSPVVARTQFTV